MIFTSYIPPLFSQKRRNEDGQPVKCRLMRYTGQITLSVPRDDPNMGYQARRPGGAVCDHMGACLIVGLQKAGHKAINFDNFQEITQRLDENPAQFLARLTETLQQYTKLDPTSAEGTIVLNTHFISQSSPDIQ